MALENLRDGDTLAVWKLDRLGQRMQDFPIFASRLNERGVDFVSLADAIDATTVSSRFFFTFMASLAQMERGIMRERPLAGTPASFEQGRTGGRKRLMTEDKIRSARKLLKQGTPPRVVANRLGVSVPTLYRWVPATSIAQDSTNPNSEK